MDVTWNMSGKYRVYSLDRTKWVEIVFDCDEMKERAIISSNLPIVEREDENIREHRITGSGVDTSAS